jgi:hypothetical protein
MPENLYDITHPEEHVEAPLEFGILKTAVGHIGKGGAETAQYLAGRKEPALAVPQAYPRLVGPLVPGAPEEYGQVHFPGEVRHRVFGTEVTMGEKEAVNAGGAEFGDYFGQIFVIVEKPFTVDIVNVYDVYPQFLKAFFCEVPVFKRVRGAKYAPPRRGVTQGDCIHGLTPLSGNDNTKRKYLSIKKYNNK